MAENKDDDLAYGDDGSSSRGFGGPDGDRGLIGDAFRKLTNRRPQQGSQQSQPYYGPNTGQSFGPSPAQSFGPNTGSSFGPPSSAGSSQNFPYGQGGQAPYSGTANAYYGQKPDPVQKIFGALQGTIQNIGSDIAGLTGGHYQPQQYGQSNLPYANPGNNNTSSGSINNRYGSFASDKEGNEAKWYVDGCSYFWAVSQALEQAREYIWILDWWLSPELYLRRPPSANEQYRLDRMLLEAAKRGVRINVIVYKEVAQALTLNSAHTKHALEAMHPNIAVFRHPDHLPNIQDAVSGLESSFGNLRLDPAGLSRYGKSELSTIFGSLDSGEVLFWAHHEKLCIIDGKTAFLGGLDLCFGRWDLNQHAIADSHPSNIDLTIWPGQDYNNARIMDFDDVSNPLQNKVDRRQSARMGWSDVSVGVYGSCLPDLKDHFLARWNYIYDRKYRARNDPRYQRLSPNGADWHVQPGQDPNVSAYAASSSLTSLPPSVPRPGSGQMQFPPPPGSQAATQPAWQSTLPPHSSQDQYQQPQQQQQQHQQYQQPQASFPPPPPNPPPVSHDQGQSAWQSTPSLQPYSQQQQQGSFPPPPTNYPSVAHDQSQSQPAWQSAPSSQQFLQQPQQQQQQSSFPQPPPSPQPVSHEQHQNQPGWQSTPSAQPYSQQPPYQQAPSPQPPLSAHSPSQPPSQPGASLYTPYSQPQANYQQSSSQFPSQTGDKYQQQYSQPPHDNPQPTSYYPPPPPIPAHPGQQPSTSIDAASHGYGYNQTPSVPPGNFAELDASGSRQAAPSGELSRGFSEDMGSYGQDNYGEDYSGERGLSGRFGKYRDDGRRLGAELGGVAQLVTGQVQNRLSHGKMFAGNDADGRSSQRTPGMMSCQIARSSTTWSNGTPTEHSVQDAYIDIIRNARHFIYIENQFFITATSHQQTPVKNQIGRAIVDRVLQAARANQQFKVMVVIPSVPGFSGDLHDDSALATRAIMDLQYKSICRGGNSIYELIAKAGYNPMDYIRFYNLRNYDRINAGQMMRDIEQQSGVGYGEASKQFDVTHGQAEAIRATNTNQGQQQFQQYQQTASKISTSGNAAAAWDTVSSAYMLNGPDIRSIPWDGSGDLSEIDAFVSEELYIHSKVLIADDSIALISSANLNDRSQLGNHDSEIAIIVSDRHTFQSSMAGSPHLASRFASSLRRTLFKKHLGLLSPQDPQRPDPTFEPPGVKDTYAWGTPEDAVVADPLSPTCQGLWNTRARTNTDIFRRVFRCVPDDNVRTWSDYKEFYEYYFEKADQVVDGKIKGGVDRRGPARYDWGHVVREDFPPGPEGVKEVKELLSRVKGTLVEMPLCFLNGEDLAREGLKLNPWTVEVYT